MGIEQSKLDSQPHDETLEQTFPIEVSIPTPKPRRLVDERPTSRSSAVASDNDLEKGQYVELIKSTENYHMPSCSPPSQNSAKKRKLEIALGEIDPNFSSSPKKATKSAETQSNDSASALPKKVFSSQERISSAHKALPQTTSSSPVRLQRNRTTAEASSSKAPVNARPNTSARIYAALPPVHRRSANHLAPIEHPLNLIPLSKLRGYSRRNDVYDVFVVIHSVGNEVIKRSRMPAKRDLRIVDPSTEKKVLLSIFVNPENFVPAVGTVALIRSVTTHEWDGGMINVYPKQCDGKQWFLPDPVGIPGCDVGHLREWWRKKQAVEAEKAKQSEEAEKAHAGRT